MEKNINKKVSDLDHETAKNFFLKEKIYCRVGIPSYYKFSNLLNDIDNHLKSFKIDDIKETLFDKKNDPKNFEEVNYRLDINKDGRFSWRRQEIINPILYIWLVRVITEENNWKIIKHKFSEWSKNDKIISTSIPIYSEDKDYLSSVLSSWYKNVEQRSLELGLKYRYYAKTDISNCYPSFYTHSIPWALHSKSEAKKYRKENDLLGNNIDNIIQRMQYGQTNGIPQGSVLIDFIAEIIFCALDEEIMKNIGDGGEFKIIRYRDDYRVFANDELLIEKILKKISSSLSEYGLSLNSHKTKFEHDLIKHSIKEDKLFWTLNFKTIQPIKDEILFIYDFSKKYPNSGRLRKALSDFHKKLIKICCYKNINIKVLISIVTNIGVSNPSVCPEICAILSVLLNNCEDDKKNDTFNSIKERFDDLPNREFIEIWLYRVAKKADIDFEPFNNKLINNKHKKVLWNINWLKNNKIKEIIENAQIFNQDIFDELSLVIKPDEISAFDINSE
ncbi:MAG TPA: RNA-directed DNA polymerase [Oligoflexia bacterium]|nr:RNA-directed DNA polymerase [Oligoflexia bacterium]HMR24669.1 RNA-directed DNA polymerase [Oligoflexia bacterium]